jgi:flagellar hook-basal body complex protein FliE
MNVGPISSQPIPSVPPPGPSSLSGGAAGGTGPAGGVPFAQLMSRFIQDADAGQQTVSHNVQQLITGETDNLHDVAISIAQADIAFRLVMEVRDQLVASYQEVMRMQV